MVRLLSDETLEEIRRDVSEHMKEIMKDIRENHTYEIKVVEGKIYKKYLDGRMEFVGRT